MESKELINDWELFLKGDSNIDESRFLTLFHYQLQEENVEAIFSHIPNGNELAINYKSLFSPYSPSDRFFNSMPVVENKIDESEALSIVKRIIQDKNKIVAILGDDELKSILSKVENNFKVVDQSEFTSFKIDDDNPDIWLTELIGSHLNRSKSYSEPFYYGLKEAFYGLTTDLQLVWYLLSPLYKSDYDPKLYFQLWKGGWDYHITENEVLLSRQL